MRFSGCSSDVCSSDLLWRADEAGLFQPVESELLNKAIPEGLRHPDGLWFGFSTRARLIYYDKTKIQPGEIKAYEDLADPKWKGKVCIRSSSNVYNQSLLSSIIEADGEAGAKEWARGVEIGRASCRERVCRCV